MKTRKSFAVLIISTVLMVCILFPISVFATHGFNATIIPFYVNGQRFDVYGYRGDSAVRLPAVRLADIAYMLNGTAAQFDIVAPPENSGWNFWVKRGTAYTPTGAEMQTIPIRNALFGSYGFLPRDSTGFSKNPHQNITVGFDGEYYPAFSVSFLSVRDIDDIYFSVYELSYWLGFHVGVGFDGWDIWDEALVISTAPHNKPAPSRHISRNTFPTGSRQIVDYAYSLRVRTGPGNDYDVLTFVHRGDVFEILDYSGRFVQIYTPGGQGWIFAGFLSRKPIALQ
ncbi:MAG: SH3 domain-containing protein [Defluviitaleaceae bacterium]|nr:SH3 domain-containing protein [Defluviitaleaceae bacterium]MCL2239130.1 SH3 domain-containing protein [Defluviitaleaceae bacterium]